MHVLAKLIRSSGLFPPGVLAILDVMECRRQILGLPLQLTVVVRTRSILVVIKVCDVDEGLDRPWRPVATGIMYGDA